MSNLVAAPEFVTAAASAAKGSTGSPGRELGRLLPRLVHFQPSRLQRLLGRDGGLLIGVPGENGLP